MKKSTKIISATLAVLALGGLAVGGYFTYKHFNPIEQQKPVDPGVTPPDDGGEEQPLVHVMTFKVGDELLPAINVATGGLITPPADPVKEGYIFAGWALEGTETPVDFSALTATEDMAFVAIFIEEPVKVTSASKFTFSGNTLTGYVGEDTDIVIPATYSLDAEGNPIDGEDIQVTAIGDAFKFNENITSVVIPEGVTSIGSFSSCSALESVTIPASTKTLKVFYGCSSLKEITIPEGVTYLPGQFVQSCSALEKITLPTTLVSIGESAFSGCSSLKEIAVPEGIKKIPLNAFSNCSSLTSITIPASVTAIEEAAFSGCEALESMVVAVGNSVYDSRNNCNAIMETATNTLIAGCKNTVIQASTQTIGAYAFYNITLTEMDIPEGVATIGYYAFYNSKLKSVNIPTSVTKIENLAFGDYSTKIIFVAGSTPAEIESKSFTSLATIYVPDEAVESFKTAWEAFASQIKPRSEYVEA